MKQALVMISLLLAFTSPAIAKSRCSNAELSKLEGRVDGSGKDISSLHRIFKEIDKCQALDGGIAEGFYDETSKLLATHFSEVVNSPLLKDEAFRKALLGSISDGTVMNIFHQICTNARSCIGKKFFCSEVAKACEDTLQLIRSQK